MSKRTERGLEAVLRALVLPILQRQVERTGGIDAHDILALVVELLQEVIDHPTAARSGQPLAPRAIVDREAMLAVLDLYASEAGAMDSWRRIMVSALRQRLENLPTINVDVTTETP